MCPEIMVVGGRGGLTFKKILYRKSLLSRHFSTELYIYIAQQQLATATDLVKRGLYIHITCIIYIYIYDRY